MCDSARHPSSKAARSFAKTDGIGNEFSTLGFTGDLKNDQEVAEFVSNFVSTHEKLKSDITAARTAEEAQAEFFERQAAPVVKGIKRAATDVSDIIQIATSTINERLRKLQRSVRNALADQVNAVLASAAQAAQQHDDILERFKELTTEAELSRETLAQIRQKINAIENNGRKIYGELVEFKDESAAAAENQAKYLKDITDAIELLREEKVDITQLEDSVDRLRKSLQDGLEESVEATDVVAELSRDIKDEIAKLKAAGASDEQDKATIKMLEEELASLEALLETAAEQIEESRASASASKGEAQKQKERAEKSEAERRLDVIEKEQKPLITAGRKLLVAREDDRMINRLIATTDPEVLAEITGKKGTNPTKIKALLARRAATNDAWMQFLLDRTNLATGAKRSADTLTKISENKYTLRGLEMPRPKFNEETGNYELRFSDDVVQEVGAGTLLKLILTKDVFAMSGLLDNPDLTALVDDLRQIASMLSKAESGAAKGEGIAENVKEAKDKIAAKAKAVAGDFAEDVKGKANPLLKKGLKKAKSEAEKLEDMVSNEVNKRLADVLGGMVMGGAIGIDPTGAKDKHYGGLSMVEPPQMAPPDPAPEPRRFMRDPGFRQTEGGIAAGEWDFMRIPNPQQSAACRKCAMGGCASCGGAAAYGGIAMAGVPKIPRHAVRRKAIFIDPNDGNALVSRLGLLTGLFNAGNRNNSELKNEIASIADQLLNIGVLDKKAHKSIHKQFFL